MTPPELGGQAFHRHPEDQETASNSLPGKFSSDNKRMPAWPVILEKIQLYFEEEENSEDAGKENPKINNI